jgi:hypothetical protein
MSAERVVGADILESTAIRVNPLTIHVVPVPLDVEPAEVIVGVPVTMTARFDGAVQQPNVTYRFVFDDDKNLPWSAEPSIRRAFPTPGTHRVYAQIGTHGDPITTTETKALNVVPPPLQSVELTVRTVNPERRQPVEFTAFVRSSHDGLQYRFHFGDGAQTEWVTSPHASHAYQAAGPHEAYVEATSYERVIKSNPVILTVRSAFPLSTILTVTLVVGLAAGAAWRWLVPRVHAEPHMDVGTQRIETPASQAISVRLRVRQGLDAAATTVECAGGPLIKRRGRSDG